MLNGKAPEAPPALFMVWELRGLRLVLENV